MFKSVIFSSHVKTGSKVRRVIYPVYPGSNVAFSKVAQQTGDLHPELRDFVNQLTPRPGYIYVLVVALGADESWSSNVNGDWFSREDLKNNHNTFVDSGKVYHLHDNTPNSPCYGDILFSRFNDNMDRVELIISVSRDDLPEVADALEKNELIDLSMGTKVEFDVCSICGNKAKRFSEYCEHLKYEMGKIYSDGKKVYALNPNPEFFDISFVDSGADRTSKALLKVAAESGNRAIVHSALLGEKVSKEKGAVLDKTVSAVEKALPEKLKIYWDALGQGLESADKIDLRKLDKNIPTDKALQVATGNDVLLRPSEFFSFFLDRLGLPEVAEKIFNEGCSLSDPSEFVDNSGIDLSGSLPLELPNIFSLRRKLEPNGITTRLRFIAGKKLAEDAGVFSGNKISVSPEIDRKLCGLYRNYLKSASHTLVKKAQVSGVKLLASLAATVLLGKALLETSPKSQPITFESSDIMGIPVGEALKNSNVSEGDINQELARQKEMLNRLRRTSPEGIEPMIQKLSAVSKVPLQILSTTATYLDSCGTKTAQVGRLLTEDALLPAIISLKFINT